MNWKGTNEQFDVQTELSPMNESQICFQKNIESICTIPEDLLGGINNDNK
jgi:hypothetical protein